jgi:type III restriction enzyme
VKIELKSFQLERTRELIKKFRQAVLEYSTTSDEQAIALSAPTGSGKTVIAASFIEEVLFGTEDSEGDIDFIFLWLTDQPQLNDQTARKMGEISDIDPDRIVVIDESFSDDFLTSGRLYFLNTQKLGANSSLVTTGGFRNTSLWQAIANTISNDPNHFVLIVDEAHRGMRDSKADPEFATTIVQRFIKGWEEQALPSVPVVVGISATIQRFHDLIGTTNRTERKVEVSVAEVRESGLVKDLTRLKSTTIGDGADMTMLGDAISEWSEFRSLWAKYAKSQGVDLLDPILLIQVEDGSGTKLSKSPLQNILATVHEQIQPEGPDWIAHAFQSGSDIGPDAYGYPLRFLAPADIDTDPDVRVVLFKSSLNTGWDCPRAEVLVSFRPASDPTSIAQLIGRMVRARLAKHIDRFEVLNTCLVLLPRYNSQAVASVITMLNGAGAPQTGSDARDESEIVWLERASGEDMNEAFRALSEIPSLVLPKKGKIRPVDRLFRLAGLLAESKFAESPVADALSVLTSLFARAYEERKDLPAFKEAVSGAGKAVIVSHDHEYGGADNLTPSSSLTVELAESDLDGRFAAAERSMSSRGLANAYMDKRLGDSAAESQIKGEFICLTFDGSVVPAIFNAADALANQWLSDYRVQLKGLKESNEDRYQLYVGLLASSGKPGVGTISAPEGAVEWPKVPSNKIPQEWDRHMYVQKKDGKFFEYLNSWERAVMLKELSDPTVVAWFRNVPRKSWSFLVTYQTGTTFTPFFPDFIVFRKNDAGLLEPSIVDPHLLNEANAPQRAAGLARFAAEFSDSFERIDLIIVKPQSSSVKTIKRLNLMDPLTRESVAQVSNAVHLQSLFDNAPLSL